ncbi:uncharacterized protein LOC121403961 isoform X2 [Drosophila obscura]|uniref:uncharacterized protein LOC121403961 isoform X2 n=1 Tax=Drosophila obscura TaxID=7282 RepID=UPI001BB10ABB|nr:uncharacterized protein LOC121403961 isoform X2 [Drosophila obscura]
MAASTGLTPMSSAHPTNNAYDNVKRTHSTPPLWLLVANHLHFNGGPFKLFKAGPSYSSSFSSSLKPFWGRSEFLSVAHRLESGRAGAQDLLRMLMKRCGCALRLLRGIVLRCTEARSTETPGSKFGPSSAQESFPLFV